MGLVVALFAFSFFFFTTNFKPIYFNEQPLYKNAHFAPKFGDILTYEYRILNETGNVSFLFKKMILETKNFTTIYANCTKVVANDLNISTCINDDGTDNESNQSLASPFFFFFAPWMLALNENFSWKSQTVSSINNEILENFSVSYIERTIFLGRDAYVVDVVNKGIFGDFEKKLWIDVKNRFVLKEEGKNYTFTLIRAWFSLNPNRGGGNPSKTG
ncbi:MAG: hypothetical protein AB1391_04380 [Candidatus Micrarchaeota archaeon]